MFRAPQYPPRSERLCQIDLANHPIGIMNAATAIPPKSAHGGRKCPESEVRL